VLYNHKWIGTKKKMIQRVYSGMHGIKAEARLCYGNETDMDGDATEITDGAGRRTENSRRIETSVEENFWP
jgi:hypothetical protein